MADEDYVEYLIKDDPLAWNRWRRDGSRHGNDATDSTLPNLAHANLNGRKLDLANLSTADLHNATFFKTSLCGADLLKADLREADFRKADLREADLREADLRKADFREADLCDADLRKADLRGANLCGPNFFGDNYKADFPPGSISEANRNEGYRRTDLCGAKLSGADLREADLRGADLRKADLRDADLTGAHLHQANLSEADLSGADLSSANLFLADLTEADLGGATLRRADLSSANLSKADLRFALDLIPDASFVKEAQFDARAKDPWSVLRRNYTGPRLIFNLLFLIAFLVPYVFKVLFWAAVNRAQAYSEAVIGERAAILGTDPETVTNFTHCLAKQCESLPVWHMILGVDKGWGFWSLAIALITYNLMKAGLTWIIAPMRDEEERSGYTPKWKGEKWWQGYQPFFWAHQYFVRWVLVVAVIAFAVNACDWLTRTVWIPG